MRPQPATTGATPRLNVDDIRRAHSVVTPHIHRLPLSSSRRLSDLTGADLRLKLENLQKTGAFKVRGALNVVSQLSDEERSRGMITVSAGNHGMALAYAARVFGSSATVCMPTTASRAKIAAIESYGGTPVLVEGTRLMESMENIQYESQKIFIHPFDDLRVMAGQGTVGWEIVEELPNVDVVILGVGGGGLLSGVATAVKSLAPRARVIGVEPENSNVVSQSLAAAHPVQLKRFGTVADGLNAPWSGPNTLGVIESLVDEVVTVSDDEIIEALLIILEYTKLLVEPAGAAAVAALLAGRISGVNGRKVVAILSGGNIDRQVLAGFLSR